MRFGRFKVNFLIQYSVYAVYKIAHTVYYKNNYFRGEQVGDL